MNKKILIIKYIASLILPALCVAIRDVSIEYFITAISSVLFVAIITNILCFKKWLGYVFNIFAMLLINIQYAVLFWSNSFITSVMINNIDSIEALSGKLWEYLITAIFVVALSFIPVARVEIKKNYTAGLFAACIALYGVVFWQGIYEKEPSFAICEVFSQQLHRHWLANEIKSVINGENEFYKQDVSGYVDKPQELADFPNVILVFTEGLSKHIIEDERNIMPNARALSDKSLSFENYFNHTFATYMGLSGQLHSGYQESNYDPNYLISLQDIFKEYGYKTTFINTEPVNPEFSSYLKDFEFDNLISDVEHLDGMSSTMSDKTAYEFLLDTAMAQSEDDKPFFISMYTFGTHVSLDSVHEKFSDGKDPLLNRFYDLDVWLGEFVKLFENSPLFDNTVFVFTSDHATYCDADFVNSFPDCQQETLSLDRIPFFIYHKGVKSEKLDVGGRNSLDMAPTVLDYLDMTGPNYFLGESLFCPYENASLLDTIYESLGSMYDTSGGSVKSVGITLRKNAEIQIAKYFATKMKDGDAFDEHLNKSHTYAEFDPIEFAVKINVTNANRWDNLEYAVWSEENGQDDLQWYSNANNAATEAVIYLSNHKSAGIYHVHVYGTQAENKELISSTTFSVTRDALKNARFFQVKYDAPSRTLNATVTNPADWNSLRYAIWSEENGQDDLKWFILEEFDKSAIKFKVDLSDYDTKGMYHIHVYADKDGNLLRIAASTIDVPNGI